MISNVDEKASHDRLDFGNEVVGVSGIIVRRRSLGKKLAFAHIKLIEPTSTGTGTGTAADCDVCENEEIIIQVVFRRHSSCWDKRFDSTFPTKNSHLPHGAKVKLLVDGKIQKTHAKEDEDGNGSQQRDDPKYEVHRWWIIFDPRKEAENVARQGAPRGQQEITNNDSDVRGEGISCSKYFAFRMDHYLKYNAQHRTIKHNLPKKMGTSEEARAFKPSEGPSSHGNKKHKAMRAKMFASFLIENFGPDFFRHRQVPVPCGDIGGGGFEVNAYGVLDIAGGKGHLSFEISLQSQTQCTIIDPLIRGKGDKTDAHGQQFHTRQIKRLSQSNAPVPNHLPQWFTLENEECMELVRRSRLIVGLHPDECTEDILDAAILWNKPCAIIPCCVFADLRPGRMLKGGDGNTNGRSVRTYDDFMQYLMEKDERIRKCTLNFQGKNQALVFDPR